MPDREGATWLLVCHRCGNGDLEMPFDSAEARGKWAAAHTRGTGHDSWWAPDPVNVTPGLLPMLRWLKHIITSPADSRFAIIATTAEVARDEVVSAMQDAFPGPVPVSYRGGTNAMVFGRLVLLIGEDDIHRLRGLSLDGLYVHGDLPAQFVETALTRVIAADAVFRGEAVDV
jgi:hypothetical protein